EREARLSAARNATPDDEPAETPAQELSAEPDAAPVTEPDAAPDVAPVVAEAASAISVDESDTTDAETPDVAVGTPADVATEINEEN
ncbi:MAG: hypothetical protein ABW122_09760, partial [Ilumatobacteraceae bacterium]